MISSADADLFSSSDKLITVFSHKVTEQNWAEMESVMREMTEQLQQNSTILSQVHEIAWKIQEPLCAGLSTERTRLAMSAMDLLSGLSGALGERFEALYDVYLSPLFRLAERTNKVISGRANKLLCEMVGGDAIIGFKYTIGKIADGLQSANRGLRGAAAEVLLTVVRAQRATGRPAGLESHQEQVEGMIEKALQDATSNVRQMGKMIFMECEESSQKRMIWRLPGHVLKSLGLQPATIVSDAPPPVHSVKAFMAAIRTSTPSTPNTVDSVDKFIDLATVKTESSSSLSLSIIPPTVTAAQNAPQRLLLSHQPSLSRLPIGPAKRPTMAREEPNVTKAAIRVIRGAASINDSIPTRSIASSDASMIKQPPELVSIVQKRDWGQRVEYLEIIKQHIHHYNSRLQVSKLSEIVLSAVGDVHFRVVEAGLKLSIEYLPLKRNVDQSFIEDLLVKLHCALLLHRARKAVCDAASVCVESLIGSSGLPLLLSHVLPNIQNRLDVMRSAKLRAVLLRTAEDLVKRAVSLYIPRPELPKILRPLALRASSALLDSDTALSAAARSLSLVIIGALGRRLLEEEILPNIRSPSIRALLIALADANPSLLPRSSPAHHQFMQIRDDEDEIVVRSGIDVEICSTPTRTNASGRLVEEMEIEALAVQLSRTPIK